jgi:ferredoxin
MSDSVDVVFAILNVDGLGVRGGTRQDMERALEFARGTGKGIYLMKSLAGGHLYRNPERALAYARDFPYKDSVCVGLKDRYEVEFASRVLGGQEPPAPATREDAPKRLVVEDWCVRCGECVKRCPFGALRVGENKAEVLADRCMLCGYCARACPHFCLKVV